MIQLVVVPKNVVVYEALSISMASSIHSKTNACLELKASYTSSLRPHTLVA
jgi:hypothetical protein